MNRNRKQFLVMLVSGILLLVWYFVIFGFSAQDGETSGGLSSSITRFCVKIWDGMTGGGMSQGKITSLSAYFEHPLRKTAHFCEYAVMGVLVHSFLYYPVKKSGRRFLFVLLWVFVSASFDELHQYFTPGRYASFMDVLLDTCGGAFGALLCFIKVKIRPVT